ncbi:MAG: TonB-dependent receptor [Kofleriaceae bacterium]
MNLRAALALLAVAAGSARAEPPPIEGHVDVEALPALPAAEDEPSSSATVLAAAAVEEDVVVGAAKREQSLGNVASAVTVVSSDRIRRFGYRTVGEAIAGVAGVFIQDTRLTQQVGIRGLQIPGGFNSRILVLIDGMSVNEAWGAFGGVGYDAAVSIDDIARIEVIRGPVSSVYGTNAFFGIINIVTRGAAEGTHAWGRIGLNSISGEIATAGFVTGRVERQLRGSVMALNRIGESSSVPGVGDDLDSDGGFTVLGAVAGAYDGTFFQLRAFRARRDSPFAPYDSDPALDPSFEYYNTQLLLEVGHSRPLSKQLTLGARAYSSLYRFEDRIHYAAADAFTDFGDAGTAGAEVNVRYAILDDNRLAITAGAEANVNRTESRSHVVGMEDAAEAIVVPLDFTNASLYSEAETQLLPWLGFTAGARFDRNSVVAKGTRLSPRAAMFLASPERYGLKLLYAEGFRNPSAFEGFFEDGVDFAANPSITSERIRSFEAVLWGKLVRGLATRLSGFYWDARDVVEQRPDPAEPERLQFQNVGRYVSAGLEAEASYRNSAGWYGFGGVTFAKVGEGENVTYDRVVGAATRDGDRRLIDAEARRYAHVSAAAR